eukprot:PRCOL_00002219-RA
MTETERIKAEVTKAFALFQAHESSPEVDEREVPTILASLGLNLTQEMLRDFVNEVRGEDSTTGLLSFDRFAKAATRVLLEHRQGEAARDSEEKLLRAFKAFDPEGKGYIEGSFLKNLLQTRGDAFRDDEADAMVAAAMDAESGRIYYEDFAELLANDGRRSLDGSA